MDKGTFFTFLQRILAGISDKEVWDLQVADFGLSRETLTSRVETNSFGTGELHNTACLTCKNASITPNSPYWPISQFLKAQSIAWMALYVSD